MQETQETEGRESPEEFAERIGLSFSDHLLLCRALTHRSFLNEHPEALEDNERLEFLGDAVLDFVVGAWLYNHFPEMSEGDMTRMRAALVKTEQLAAFAKQLDMGPALRLGRGEEEGGGRERLAMLCASFEALIGALFLDREIEAVEEFVSPMLARAAETIMVLRGDRDPKSLLQEWAQAQGFETPSYQIVEENGPDHEKTFTVQVLVAGEAYAEGAGPSKQSASKEAAREALEKLTIR